MLAVGTFSGYTRASTKGTGDPYVLAVGTFSGYTRASTKGTGDP